MARSHPSVVQSAIAAQRRTLATEERNRSKAWNSTVPINCLPNEVLSDLFETYIRVREAKCFPPGCGGRSRHVKTPWFNILHVCTHWHDLVTGTPTHWKIIYVGLSVEWLDLCLSRSASAPVDVYFVDSNKVPAVLLEHLLPHHHRIRILKFDSFPDERLPQVADLLRRDMPALTTLNLDKLKWLVSTPSLHVRALPPLDTHTSLAETLPRLTTVILSFLHVPRDAFTLCHLRELVLNACSVDMSFSELIHVIGQCQVLERLVLYSFFDRLLDAPAMSLNRICSSAPIVLPHLHSIEITENTTTMTSAFLSSFILPAANRVYMEGKYDGIGPCNGVAPILPPSITLPVLSTLTFAKLSPSPCNIEDAYLVGAVTFDPSFPHRTPIYIEVIGSERHPVQIKLRGLATLLHGAPLESLEIGGVDVVLDSEDSQAWFDVFETFPRLEKLDVFYISSAESFKALWSGLRRVSSVGIDDHVIGPASRNHGRPPPYLRHITFHLWSPEDPLEPSFNLAIDEMLLYLRERAMVGARLELLKWDRRVGSNTRSLHPQLVDATRALLARVELEGLVGEVVIAE